MQVGIDGVCAVCDALVGEAAHHPVAVDHVWLWFVYVVKLPAGVDRDGVMSRLADQGIATAPYLPSIHLQSYMRERYGFGEGCFRSARTAARDDGLPFHARLDRSDQERVAERSARRWLNDLNQVRRSL